MLSDDQTRRILDAVDAGFDAQLSFTQDLVKHPSLRTREGSAQDLMFGAMSGRGLDMDRWELDQTELSVHEGFGPVTVSYAGMTNVVGTYRPGIERGRSLILNGHIDVVPEGPAEDWTRFPWDAPVIDGWMYGRGAGDMKAGLAANLFAFDAVRAAGFEPAGRIHFQSVVEEECTGNGSLSALMRGYQADAVIIPEPEEDMLVRANVGVVWFKVRVTGNPTHPREMGTGFNAIDAAYTAMTALRGVEKKWNAEREAHRHFEDVEHPINFNFGGIAGGDWPSSVPAWCEFDVRAAIYPGIAAKDAWAELQACLAQLGTGPSPIKAVGIKTGFFAEGYVLEPGSDAENLLSRTHEKVFGVELKSFTTPGYLDGRVFALYADTPALVYGPVSESIHGFDERVSVESVRRITKSIALFIADWCGLDEQPLAASEG
ncbi:ArgE/DapE family deacylase [Pseudarthrobacter sp. PS3-L1]|uniref:ArgE/DapE family deacylase n=1 Tax=Pseudarthrobacter sp. PS3-L1 TaxID=3046207 RepID=UPI0024B8A957|nr:ArgE/DapE family deacylase [Pseudarthrobacter sp. PS3-L1]MDJ0319524.1 ArgE/DapE family deacylase [Pseudarthrobacter sp. PS3-L1]